MNDKIEIALIYGSTREGRFCDHVALWAGEEIWQRSEFALDMVDPAALDLPPRHERAESPELASLRQRLERADAFMIVTPEYNHGYPAALKFLIDSVSDAWRGKPVTFVSYGGISGGLRAVEQLRQVFAELHAVTVRDTVSFPRVWEQFDQNGELRDPARAREAMDTMLAGLNWWAHALRAARSEAVEQVTPAV